MSNDRIDQMIAEAIEITDQSLARAAVRIERSYNDMIETHALRQWFIHCSPVNNRTKR